VGRRHLEAIPLQRIAGPERWDWRFWWWSWNGSPCSTAGGALLRSGVPGSELMLTLSALGNLGATLTLPGIAGIIPVSWYCGGQQYPDFQPHPRGAPKGPLR